MHYNNKFNVIVIGGGVAGVSAAVAVAKRGKSVLLIEKNCYLGGLATSGIISWYEPICNGLGEKIMSGESEEMLKRAIKNGYDTLDKSWGGKRVRPNKRYNTFFSPTFFSLTLLEFCLENNVKIRFDTVCGAPILENNKIVAVKTESASGEETFYADVFIDCSGTAVFSKRVGVPTVEGDNNFVYISHECNLDDAENAVNEKDIGKIRNWKNAGYEPDYTTRWKYPDSIKKIQGVDSDSETDWLIQGQMATLQRYKNTDRETRELLSIPNMPQYRTIRRIIGDYEFIGLNDKNEDDRIIGRLNDVGRAGVTHLLSYGCLYNKDFPNLLVGGRIISASGNGWDITRIIPVCVLTGQTAGISAVLAIDDGKPVCQVDYGKLKNELLKENVAF